MRGRGRDGAEGTEGGDEVGGGVVGEGGGMERRVCQCGAAVCCGFLPFDAD